MKIAIPMAGGRLCMHFGHCEQFALVDVDETAGKLTGTSLVTPPPHEPGVFAAVVARARRHGNHCRRHGTTSATIIHP